MPLPDFENAFERFAREFSAGVKPLGSELGVATLYVLILFARACDLSLEDREGVKVPAHGPLSISEIGRWICRLAISTAEESTMAEERMWQILLEGDGQVTKTTAHHLNDFEFLINKWRVGEFERDISEPLVRIVITGVRGEPGTDDLSSALKGEGLDFSKISAAIEKVKSNSNRLDQMYRRAAPCCDEALRRLLHTLFERPRPWDPRELYCMSQRTLTASSRDSVRKHCPELAEDGLALQVYVTSFVGEACRMLSSGGNFPPRAPESAPNKWEIIFYEAGNLLSQEQRNAMPKTPGVGRWEQEPDFSRACADRWREARCREPMQRVLRHMLKQGGDVENPRNDLPLLFSEDEGKKNCFVSLFECYLSEVLGVRQADLPKKGLDELYREHFEIFRGYLDEWKECITAALRSPASAEGAPGAARAAADASVSTQGVRSLFARLLRLFRRRGNSSG